MRFPALEELYQYAYPDMEERKMKTFLVPARVTENGITRKIVTKVEANNEYQAKLVTIGIHGVKHEGINTIIDGSISVVIIDDDIQEFYDYTNG
jgi:hypothetical protein